MKHNIIIKIAICLCLLFVVQTLWATGQEEVVEVAPEEPNQLLSKYRISNSGVIYEFYETKPLPQGASYGILNLYNINSKNPPINQQILITPDMETFKYSITHPYNSFYPLLPFVATLTIIDSAGEPLRTSEAKFNSFFAFYQDDSANPNNEVSDSILFSTENKVVQETNNYSKLYNLSDEKIHELLEYQIKLSVDYFQGEEKHLLLTGIAFTDDQSNETYTRILKKTQLIQNIISTFEDSYDSLEIDIALYSKDSMDYANNLYPSNDQAVIRISDNINDINVHKDKHIALNIEHITNINNDLYDVYFEHKAKVVTAINNANTILHQNEIMELGLANNNIAMHINEATSLDVKMDEFIINTNLIMATLQDLESQFDLMNSSKAVNSLTSILDTIQSRGLDDLPIFNELLSLKLRNKDNEFSFEKIVSEYRERKEFIEKYRIMNKELLVKLKEIETELNLQTEHFDSEFNLEELKSFKTSLLSLNNTFNELNSLKLHYANSSQPVMNALLENLSNATTLIETLESEIITLTEETHAFSFNANDNAKVALAANPENRLENISLGVNNILEMSQTLVYQVASIESIDELNNKRDSAYTLYKDIFATVSPILNAKDEEVMSIAMRDLSELPKAIDKALPNALANTVTPMQMVTPYKPQSNIATVPSTTKITSPLATNSDLINNSEEFLESIDPNDSATIDLTFDQLNNLYDENKIEPPNTQASFAASANTESQITVFPNTSNMQIRPTRHEDFSPSAQNNTSEASHNVLGKASINKNQVYNYINSTIRIPPNLDVTNIIHIYFEEAYQENVNPEIAIAQMLYATNMLQNKTLLARYNPAGLGGPSTKNWQLYPFPNFRTGIRAHIQHLKAYASTEALSNDIVDPRYKILRDNKIIGSAPTVEKVVNSWYNYRKDASDKIFSILNEMINFSL